MFTDNWPLVAFTLLVQTSVGLLIVGEVCNLAGGAATRGLFRFREPVALLFGLAGLGFSFEHLGTPAHSPFAIMNLATSWLSREILFTGAFIGCLAALTVLRRALPGGLSRALALLTVLLGVASVFAMTKVYAIPTVPAWNSPATLLNFAGTTMLMGALATGLLASFRWSGAAAVDERASVARVTAVLLGFLVVGLAAKFVEIPMSLVAGADENARGVSALSEVMAAGIGLFATRLVLLVIGVALFAPVAILAARGSIVRFGTLGTFAFLFTLAGEVLGRMEFFRMQVLFGL